MPIYSTEPGAGCISAYSADDFRVYSRGCDERFPDAQKIRFRVEPPRGTEEASAHRNGGYITLKEPNFFTHDPDTRKTILYHEAGHFFEEEIAFGQRRFGELLDSGIWCTEQVNPNTGQVYWRGVFGHINSIAEDMADAYAAWHLSRQELRERWPDVHAFMKKEMGNDCGPVEGEWDDPRLTLYERLKSRKGMRRAAGRRSCRCPPSIASILRATRRA